MNKTAALVGILALVLAACGGAPAKSPSSSPDGEPPMPSGKGTKRALVLVDDPKPSGAAQPVEDQYSTRRIVEKVTAP